MILLNFDCNIEDSHYSFYNINELIFFFGIGITERKKLSGPLNWELKFWRLARKLLLKDRS